MPAERLSKIHENTRAYADPGGMLSMELSFSDKNKVSYPIYEGGLMPRCLSPLGPWFGLAVASLAVAVIAACDIEETSRQRSDAGATTGDAGGTPLPPGSGPESGPESSPPGTGGAGSCKRTIDISFKESADSKLEPGFVMSASTAGGLTDMTTEILLRDDGRITCKRGQSVLELGSTAISSEEFQALLSRMRGQVASELRSPDTVCDGAHVSDGVTYLTAVRLDDGVYVKRGYVVGRTELHKTYQDLCGVRFVEESKQAEEQRRAAACAVQTDTYVGLASTFKYRAGLSCKTDQDCGLIKVPAFPEVPGFINVDCTASVSVIFADVADLVQKRLNDEYARVVASCDGQQAACNNMLPGTASVSCERDPSAPAWVQGRCVLTANGVRHP